MDVARAFVRIVICSIISIQYIHLAVTGVLLVLGYFLITSGFGVLEVFTICRDLTISSFGPSALLLLYCNLLICIINVGLFSVSIAFMPKFVVSNSFNHLSNVLFNFKS